MEKLAMKAMVEFHLKPGSKKTAIELFEQRGPNRVAGVTFRGAWICTRSDVVFVLIESTSEAQIVEVSESWKAHGESTIHPVLDIEQY
jgi:hypothetical protein